MKESECISLGENNAWEKVKVNVISLGENHDWEKAKVNANILLYNGDKKESQQVSELDKIHLGEDERQGKVLPQWDGESHSGNVKPGRRMLFTFANISQSQRRKTC